jgi:hypothetical protein
LCSTPSIIRTDQVKEDDMGRACSTKWIREMHIGYRWEIQKEETPLGRPRHRYRNNIKMDLREIGWDGSIWLRIGTSGGIL